MEQSLLTRKKFHKCTKFLNALYGSFIYRPHFWLCSNALNPGYCFFQAFFGRTEYTYLTLVTYFFNINGCSCFALNFLDHFTLWSDYGANKLFVNKQFNHSWCV